MRYIPREHHQLIPEYEKEFAYVTTSVTAVLGPILALLFLPYIFDSILTTEVQSNFLMVTGTISLLLFLLWPLTRLPLFPKNWIQPFNSLILILEGLITIPIAFYLSTFSDIFFFFGLMSIISIVVFWDERWNIFTQAILVIAMIIISLSTGVLYNTMIWLNIAGFSIFCTVAAGAHYLLTQYRWKQFFTRHQIELLNKELHIRTAELDTFVHTVAHDLKSPLSGTIGYTQLLQDSLAKGSYPDEQIDWLLECILTLNFRSIRIINELLLFAETNKADVATEPIDMSTIVYSALTRVQHHINDNNATIDVASNWPTALGYAPWLEEVWANYISNAIKYGGKPPRIELGGETDIDGTARFWVRDNGKGLTTDEQCHLFVEFSRLDKTREVQGHGLGLSIVSRIIEKLDGTVGVTSELGEGSVFYFTLPAISP